MFEAAEAYEQLLGRWSRQLAPDFVEFAGVQNGERILDVGCGTGSLSATLAKATRASKIVGIDQSENFVDYARSKVHDSRARFEVGDAQNLPFPDHSFDGSMALFIFNFIPNARKAMNEMRRVTRSGGVVATANWDGSNANELVNGFFWDAAKATDPSVKRPSERPSAYGSAETLSDLLKQAGLKDLAVREFTLGCPFSCFNEYWQRYLLGEGPSGTYVAGLSADHRQRLKKHLRHDVLRGGNDGPFTLKAIAWGVRGIAP